MHAFDVLGDPVRRRIVELLAGNELTAGQITDHVRAEFGITQPAVSRHLRVLRDAGFASSEAQAQRRLYRLQPEPLAEVDAWLARYRGLWSQALDALGTELSRGRRATAQPQDDEESHEEGQS